MNRSMISWLTGAFRTVAAVLLGVTLAIVAIPGPAAPQQLNTQQGAGPFAPGGAYSYQQFLGPFFTQPNFTFSPNSLVVTWSPGFVYAGNGSVPVVQGSVTLTASKTT